MKHHLMIALGLLMAVIFAYRFAHAILAPGWGLLEIYLLGGLVLAGLLITGGLRERKAARDAAEDRDV